MKQIFYVLLCVRQQGAVYTWFSQLTLNYTGENGSNSDFVKNTPAWLLGCCSHIFFCCCCSFFFFWAFVFNSFLSQRLWGNEDNETAAPISRDMSLLQTQ